MHALRTLTIEGRKLSDCAGFLHYEEVIPLPASLRGEIECNGIVVAGIKVLERRSGAVVKGFVAEKADGTLHLTFPQIEREPEPIAPRRRY